jgi:glycosyltransferase involved in cell wall biosynthesis
MTPARNALHILVILEPLPYPMDVRVRGQVDGLVGAGYAVTVVCPTGHGFDALEEWIGPVRVLRYPAPPAGLSAPGYLREYGLAFVALARLVRRVRRDRRIDLAFVCNPPDILVSLAVPLRRGGTRILFDFREISPELFEAKFGGRSGAVHMVLRRLLLSSERFAFRHADVVTTVSRPCADIAHERGGVDRDRIFIVGNGPDPRRIFPVPAQPELRRGRDKLVLWLGAMSQQEGLERLVETADELVNRLGRTDVAFALVGPGDAHDTLMDDVRRRGLERVVDVRGAVDDASVRAYMATADVCVGVDERNSVNDRAAMRKIFEYMAMGRPVVQFPLAEMARLCRDATAYARNGDSSDLARQIAGLLDDRERAERLGQAAQRRVNDGLMWPDQVPAMLEAVELALALGRRRRQESAPDA